MCTYRSVSLDPLRDDTEYVPGSAAVRKASDREETEMKIHALKFALAWAAAAAVVWLICALFVFSIPGPSMMMSRNMMHSDMGHWNWTFSLGGALIGTLLWSFLAGLFGWLVAIIYNALDGRAKPSEA